MTDAADSTQAARRASYQGVLAALVLAAIITGRPAGPAGAAVTPADARLHLNPNYASRDELMLLPEIGPTMADRIIAYRSLFAPGQAFFSTSDLDPIRLVGPVTLEKIQPYLTFDFDELTPP